MKTCIVSFSSAMKQVSKCANREDPSPKMTNSKWRMKTGVKYRLTAVAQEGRGEGCEGGICYWAAASAITSSWFLMRTGINVMVMKMKDQFPLMCFLMLHHEHWRGEVVSYSSRPPHHPHTHNLATFSVWRLGLQNSGFALARAIQNWGKKETHKFYIGRQYPTSWILR
jgi:hypothetical protein